MILGRFKGRVAKDWKPEFSNAGTGSLQLPVDLDLRNEKGDLVQTVSSFLSFASTESARISVERLRALGWKGTPEEISRGDIKGPFDLEADVQVSERTHNGQTKVDVDIMTGGGRFKASAEKVVPPAEAGARIAAVLGLVAAPPAAGAPGASGSGKPLW